MMPHRMHGLLASATAMMLGLTLSSSGATAADQTIPSAAGTAASRCTVGQSCTFAAPIFACDSASAEMIAAAGPVKGGEVGFGLIRENKCQVMPAGRPLGTEATKSGSVIYLTENGQHLGYMPVGVFASGGVGTQATCQAPGFCAVRPGSPIWVCPKAESLTLATPDAKSGAKCLNISDSNAGEVTSVSDNTVTLANMFGGKPPYASVYYAARGDFVGLSLDSRPTPAARGWCRPDTWCVTASPTLLCRQRAAYERVEAAPPGEPRRLVLKAELGCRIVAAGNLLKPLGLAREGDPLKLVEAGHPMLVAGWASTNAFPVIAFNPPLRDTARMDDLTVSESRTPTFSAIDIRGQGTSTASGVFRSGPRERREFCTSFHGEDQTESRNSCLSEPDTTITVKANCGARRLTVDGRQYGLLERPRDAAPDIHYNEHRQMLYRELKSGEWLDGSTLSGERSVETAFNALCPGVDPEASFGLVYRDPRAEFPRELWGRWFDNRRACADPQRNADDYEGHTVMELSAQGRNGNFGLEYPQRVNAVRRVGPQSWQIDGSHRIDVQDVPEIFDTMTYTLTREGLSLRSDGRAPIWVRCR